MKLLIAYDGSECSDAAIVDLRRAGLPLSAQALVLSVADCSPVVASVPYAAAAAGPGLLVAENNEVEVSVADALKQANRFAAEAADRLRADFPKWQVSTEAWADSAGPAIVRKVHARNPDLIVVGSHGRSGFKRMALGSVSQHVLHHVNCSVRISRHHLHSQERPIRLLVGLDGSACAKAALEVVAQRTWPAGTEARVMGVMDCGSMRANPITLTPEALPPIMEENWRKQLSKTINEAADKLHMAGLVATPHVITGKACQVLLGEAEKWAADCLFVGARGLVGLERILLGSVSTAVSSRARCSVEVVRSKAG
jgi:nucleotide-binding universal stress UspA family protein